MKQKITSDIKCLMQVKDEMLTKRGSRARLTDSINVSILVLPSGDSDEND